MKYCQKCGAQNPDEAKFCDSCGYEFPRTASSSFTKEYSQQELVSLAQDEFSADWEKYSRYWTIAIVLGFLFGGIPGLLIAVVFYFMKSDKEQELVRKYKRSHNL